MTDRLPLARLLEQYRANWPESVKPETTFMLGLIRLNDIVDRHARGVMARYDLTLAGFETLATLRAADAPMTPNDIRRAVLITSGGMTKVLKTLAADHLIDMVASSTDRRSKRIVLTASGRQRVEQCMAAVSKSDRELLSRSLSDGEIRRIGTLFLQTVERLETE